VKVNYADIVHHAERTHKQVVVIRTDLGMRKGKFVAQGCHASEAAMFERGYIQDNELRIPLDADLGPWLLGLFAKAVVYVQSEAELRDVYDRAKAAGLPCALIEDSGLTEFHNVPTLTAVAVGPALTEKVDRITGELPLL
jgi:PTH2 family peptidyl-tRNA hydrolase